MFDRIKENRVVRTAAAVNRRYGQDAGGHLSASIAYYGFLSLFPLALLALSVVGFALSGNPEFRAHLEERVLDAVPGLQTLVGRNLDAVTATSGSIGLIGLAGLLWTGTGVVGAGRNALRLVFREGAPPGGFGDRVRLVGLTAGLGVVALAATGLAATAAGLDPQGPLGLALRLLGAAVAFGLDLVLFLVTYRVLTLRRLGWRALLPGALFAAAGWWILKLVGTWYATTTVQRSETVYGPFAATVGVLELLYLAARVFLYGAELNAVLLDKGGGDRMNDGERHNTADPREVSTVRLVGQVAGDVGTLVKKEVELARQEITEAIAARVKAAVAFVVVAVVALFVV
ncbi:MAG TPA: YihY/virulence factor BrkB family protein, partial [Actinomycetota bacterium]|nr:YihY/virulence factor BrkB family protein [Actinomycetota bacterium]